MTTTTDISEQNNTGPLGRPVINDLGHITSPNPIRGILVKWCGSDICRDLALWLENLLMAGNSMDLDEDWEVPTVACVAAKLRTSRAAEWRDNWDDVGSICSIISRRWCEAHLTGYWCSLIQCLSSSSARGNMQELASQRDGDLAMYFLSVNWQIIRGWVWRTAVTVNDS